MGFRFVPYTHRDNPIDHKGVKIMALSIGKIILILIAVINLVLIAVFTILGKNKVAIALAVFEAFLVASAGIVE